LECMGYQDYPQVGEGKVGHDTTAVLDHSHTAPTFAHELPQRVGHGLCFRMIRGQIQRHTPPVCRRTSAVRTVALDGHHVGAALELTYGLSQQL
jgi:hypothetical protein